jgi:hypothetical protein
MFAAGLTLLTPASLSNYLTAIVRSLGLHQSFWSSAVTVSFKFVFIVGSYTVSFSSKWSGWLFLVWDSYGCFHYDDGW